LRPLDSRGALTKFIPSSSTDLHILADSASAETPHRLGKGRSGPARAAIAGGHVPQDVASGARNEVGYRWAVV
jgi:hypothetical protein